MTPPGTKGGLGPQPLILGFSADMMPLRRGQRQLLSPQRMTMGLLRHSHLCHCQGRHATWSTIGTSTSPADPVAVQNAVRMSFVLLKSIMVLSLFEYSGKQNGISRGNADILSHKNFRHPILPYFERISSFYWARPSLAVWSYRFHLDRRIRYPSRQGLGQMSSVAVFGSRCWIFKLRGRSFEHQDC